MQRGNIACFNRVRVNDKKFSTDINGGSGGPWSRDARCRGFVQWDMAGSASSLYQRSTLWQWLRLDSTLTQFMGCCR